MLKSLDCATSYTLHQPWTKWEFAEVTLNDSISIAAKIEQKSNPVQIPHFLICSMISTRLRGRTAAERLAAKKLRQQQRKAKSAGGGGVGAQGSGNSIGFFGPKTGPKCQLKRIHASTSHFGHFGLLFGLKFYTVGRSLEEDVLWFTF